MKCRAFAMTVALVGLALSSTLVAQRTWMVDQAGGVGVDFLDIPPAIVASAPGDRIEVLGTGLYSSFLVTKPLDIEAMQQALVYYFRVEGLAAGENVRVAGFACQPRPTYPLNDEAVIVQGCLGCVVLSDLDVWCRAGDRVDGFIIRDSSCVAVQDCIIRGRSRGIVSGGPGMVIRRSQVSIVRTRAIGGDGGSSISNAAGERGGHGIVIDSGSVYVADSIATGGVSGYGFFYIPDGGDGVAINGLGPVTIARSTITRGVSQGAPGVDGDAVNGPARVTTDGTITGALTNGAVLINRLTMLQADARVMIGATLNLQVDGYAGANVLLCADVKQGHHQLLGLSEPFLLTFTCFSIAAPTLTSNSWTASFTVPNVPALKHCNVFFQAVVREPTGLITLTPLAITRVE